MKKTAQIVFTFIVILFVVSFFIYKDKVFKKEAEVINEEVETEILDEKQDDIEPEIDTSSAQGGSVPSETPEQIMSSVLYPVPFAPQAPHANWDMPYQEACEEAAMIMIAKYAKKEKFDAQIMDEEILKLVAWQEKNNYPIDLTADQIVEVLKKYFFINAYTDTETNVQNIKDLLNQKKLIIIPAAGRQLGNPYFTGVGPLYHNLVIIGYDEDEFITNDPGTRRGEKYRYKYFDLINAIHDWNGGVRVFKDPRPEPDITKGKKVMVVID